MSVLTAGQRNRMPAKTFAGPDRSYPIPDASHARDALSRVSPNGSPAVKAQVRAKVAAKFPGIGQSSPQAEAMRRKRAMDPGMDTGDEKL